MIDQLRIGDKYSYDDFEASVKERKKTSPKKKKIKETVPFSNQTYDFSAINGEVYWEERELTYVFEITASSAEELETKKQPFVSWVMNVMDEEIHDPFIENYHFIGTFADIEEDDSEFEKSTITVKFTAYPYMLANQARTSSRDISAEKAHNLTIKNSSSHRIIPTITATRDCLLKFGNVSYDLSAGETLKSSLFALDVGENVITIQGKGYDGIITFEYTKEIF